MKTLNDFKQEVAEKYGFDKWYKLLDSVEWEQVPDLLEEAAERYAEYREHKGEERGLNKRIEEFERGHKQGWNEALDTVLEYEMRNGDCGYVMSEDIKKLTNNQFLKV